MRVKPIQCNFTAGEWSPRLHGRSDLQKYWNAVEALENFIILPQGGITRRPGFHFVKEVKDSTRKVRLIPFIFSTEQAYIIEAGNEYFRFYMNHGQIQSIPSDTKLLLHFDGPDQSTDIIDSSSGGHTITVHGTAQLDTSESKFGSASMKIDPSVNNYITIADHADFDFSGGVCTIDTWYYPVTKSQLLFYQETDANNYIKFDIYSTGSEPLTKATVRFRIVAAGVTVLTLASSIPLNMNEWNHIALTENGNAYYLWINGALGTSANSAIRAADYDGVVKIGGAGQGWFDEFHVSNGALYLNPFTPPTTPYGISGAEIPYEKASTYLESELAVLKWAQSADTLWLVHPKHAPATLTRTGHASWTLANISFTSAPADWGAGNWPMACAFHEQRFCYGGTYTSPQTVWLSVSASYNDFTTGTADADSCTYTIPADQVNGINWLASMKGLIIGTSGGEYMMNGGDIGITPTSIEVKSLTAHRSYNLNPVRVGPSVLFLQKYGLKIRELAYRYDDDSYHAPDLCLLAEHITESGLKFFSYQQEPDSILWTGRTDGIVPTLSYLREEDILGWARQLIANGDVEVEDGAVIPDPTTSYDEVWAVVKIDIDGSTKRYIGYFDPDMPVDLGITYSGAAVSTVSGLDHLEGETVDIVGDGIVRTQDVVTSGSVSLNGDAASLIYVGLPFTSKVITMKPNFQAGAGTTAGMPKKWAEVYVDLLESCGVKINGDQIPFRTVGDAVGAAVVPFTGFKRVSTLGWNDGRITIEQTLPLPCTIRGIYGTLEIGD